MTHHPHTYYDLSKKGQNTKMENPNSSKYYDSVIAVPIFNKKFKDRVSYLP